MFDIILHKLRKGGQQFHLIPAEKSAERLRELLNDPATYDAFYLIRNLTLNQATNALENYQNAR